MYRKKSIKCVKMTEYILCVLYCFRIKCKAPMTFAVIRNVQYNLLAGYVIMLPPRKVVHHPF